MDNQAHAHVCVVADDVAEVAGVAVVIVVDAVVLFLLLLEGVHVYASHRAWSR